MMAGQMFDGPRFGGFKLTPEELCIIGLDTEDGEEHSLYDERIKLPVNEGLVKNIMAIGVKKPVIVVKDSQGRPCVVDGRQRVRAAREANKLFASLDQPQIRVPVVTESAKETSELMLMAIGVSTNEHNVSDDPMVKAQKAKRLKDRGVKLSDIAVYFGVTVQSINNWLSMLGLAAPVVAAVEAGVINQSTALTLGTLPVEKQEAALKEMIEEVEEEEEEDSAILAEIQKLEEGGGSSDFSIPVSAPSPDPTSGKEQKKEKKPSKKDAEKIVAREKGEDYIPVPSPKKIKTIVEMKPEALSVEFLKGLSFAIGLIASKEIPGLDDILVELAKKPVKMKPVTKREPKKNDEGPAPVYSEEDPSETPSDEENAF